MWETLCPQPRAWIWWTLAAGRDLSCVVDVEEREIMAMLSTVAETPRGWGGRLPLGYKVMLAVGGLVGLLTVTILLAVALMARLATAEMRLNDREIPFASSVDAAALQAKGVANDERGFLMTGDRRYLGEADARIAHARAAFAAAAQAANDAEERRTVSAASDSFETWVIRLQEEFAAYPRDHAASVDASLGSTREVRKNYESSLAQAQVLAQRSIADSDTAIAGAVSRSTRILLGCLAVVLLSGFLMGWWLVRLIAVPLHRLLTFLAG
jgi:methyl-accepting chemotaxis protein